MKESLEAKIEEIINYILAKPVSEISPMEYGILDAKLKDIYMKKNTDESNQRLMNLMAEIAKRGSYPMPENV